MNAPNQPGMSELSSRYTDGSYLESTGTWHEEDSSWKAAQVMKLIEKHRLPTGLVGEVGCGVGGVLKALKAAPTLRNSKMRGFDLSPHAIEIANRGIPSRDLTFTCGNVFEDSTVRYDLLLAMDVFEHVPDYLGFLNQCRTIAEYKIYHIPLDIHVLSVLFDTMSATRASVGHLHYFTEASALATLRDTGHEIIDYALARPATELFHKHFSMRRAVGNLVRLASSVFGNSFAAKVAGGYTVLALTR